MGQNVVKEGTMSDYVYMVKQGEFTVTKENLKTVDKNMIDYLYPDERAEEDKRRLGFASNNRFGLSKSLIKPPKKMNELTQDQSKKFNS